MRLLNSPAMKVTAIAGGVGGAKLLVGLDAALPPQHELTAIVNTGDDTVIYGVHVSPDVDIVTYWLAGLADRAKGWGLAGDTWKVVEGLRSLGAEAWFSLGDRDFATCLHRTERLRAGDSLSSVTDDIRRTFGVRVKVLPMSDDPVRTLIETSDGRTLEFQEYFVKERQEPEVRTVTLSGMEGAKPGPEVLEAIRSADRVIICPSNPVVSVGPILALPGVREALVEHAQVTAVTPIVEGKPLKGPADKLLRAVGADVSPTGVARLYADFCNRFALDARDADEAPAISSLGMEPVALDTIMNDDAASLRLAQALL